MKAITVLFLFTLSGLAQTAVNLPALTVSAEATAALNPILAGTFTGTHVSLTAPVAIGDTTISVVSTAGIAATSAINIEGEAMKINAKTTTSFTVTRGIYGTTAAAHAVTAQVNELRFPTIQKALLQAVSDWVGVQMETTNSTTIAAQNAAITNANAAKAAAKAAAIQ